MRLFTVLNLTEEEHLFFHFFADIKDGFYEKFESQLQGQNNTYYVGGLTAFELTERNSSYAMALIRKHFASDNPMPQFSYVKVI